MRHDAPCVATSDCCSATISYSRLARRLVRPACWHPRSIELLQNRQAARAFRAIREVDFGLGYTVAPRFQQRQPSASFTIFGGGRVCRRNENRCFTDLNILKNVMRSLASDAA